MSIQFSPLDIAHCFDEVPIPLDFILPGFVASTVGCLAAAGSTGKSFAALEVAMGICSLDADKSLLNMGICKEGEVAIFNAEDPSSVLHQRLNSISSHLSPEVRQKVIRNLTIYPLVGKCADVMAKEWQETILKAAKGKRLLIFDTFTRWHKLNENDNGQMSQVIGVFEMIATETGASVLFLHHTGKSAAMNGEQDKQQSTRGASAITDNCRWQAFMQTMTEDEMRKLNIPAKVRKSYVQIGGNKENYGAPTNHKWLKRVEGGVLLPADEIKQIDKSSTKSSVKVVKSHSTPTWHEKMLNTIKERKNE